MRTPLRRTTRLGSVADLDSLTGAPIERQLDDLLAPSAIDEAIGTMQRRFRRGGRRSRRRRGGGGRHRRSAAAEPLGFGAERRPPDQSFVRISDLARHDHRVLDAVRDPSALTTVQPSSS
ncbi:MAG: hypothetical protein R2713_06715 [Ilumatobacteraceae bacterium]